MQRDLEGVTLNPSMIVANNREHYLPPLSTEGVALLRRELEDTMIVC